MPVVYDGLRRLADRELDWHATLDPLHPLITRLSMWR
jgi:hypothetical protein